MRIVAGRHRGRRLEAPEDGSVRPTSDRVRENLFNVLAHGRFSKDGTSPLADAIVLDAFAGTGALGLEALSRGARHAIFVDRDLTALECVARNAAALGEGARVTSVLADATAPPDPASVRGWPGPATLVFLDPPYESDLAAPATDALLRRGWIAPGALLVAEVPAAAGFLPPPGFEILDERRYGGTRIVFLRHRGEDPARP